MNSRLGRREEIPNLALIIKAFLISFKICHTMKVFYKFKYFPRNCKYMSNFQEMCFELVCFIFRGRKGIYEPTPVLVKLDPLIINFYQDHAQKL